jgi:hypothetical protein
VRCSISAEPQLAVPLTADARRRPTQIIWAEFPVPTQSRAGQTAPRTAIGLDRRDEPRPSPGPTTTRPGFDPPCRTGVSGVLIRNLGPLQVPVFKIRSNIGTCLDATGQTPSIGAPVTSQPCDIQLKLRILHSRGGSAAS